MTKSATITKTQTLNEVEDESPSTSATRYRAEEDEPPSKTSPSNKSRFFGFVPEGSWNDWRWHFRNRITTVDELARFIPLTAKEQAQLKLVTLKYPLSITPYYLSLINTDAPDDPIRKQAVPSFDEVALSGLGMEDPLEEKRDSVVPGLVHRYPDRVLMVLTNLCPMLCRHCTRKREWRHGGWVRTPSEIEAMLGYIRRNKSVRDVILSGGGGKVPLQPNYVLSQTEDAFTLRNYQGRIFNYRNPRVLNTPGNGHQNARRVSYRSHWPLDQRQLGLPVGAEDESGAIV